MTTDLTKKATEVVVSTSAKPPPDALMAARGEIQRDPELFALFIQFSEEKRDNEWLADNLAVRLSARWGGHDFSVAMDAAQYLADEYEQVVDGGDGSVYMVNTETGKLIRKITPEAIYTPTEVPRESGNMAMPLPRVHPEIEAQVIHDFHEKGRELAIQASLAKKAVQTEFLATTGDRRLRIATRNGRKTLAEEIREDFLANLLSKEGPAAHLHGLFPFSDRVPAHGNQRLIHASPLVTIPLQDPSTTNVHFNRRCHVVSALYRGLMNDVGHAITQMCEGSQLLETATMAEFKEMNCRMWLAPPAVAVAMQRHRLTCRAVEGAPVVVGIMNPAGSVLTEFKDLTSVELHDKWRIQAHVDLTVHLWTEELRVFEIPKIEDPHLAEVVR